MKTENNNKRIVVLSHGFDLIISEDRYEVSKISGLGINKETGIDIPTNIYIESIMLQDEFGNNTATLFDFFDKYKKHEFNMEICIINPHDYSKYGNRYFLLENCKILGYFVSDFDATSGDDYIVENVKVLPGKLVFKKEQRTRVRKGGF